MNQLQAQIEGLAIGLEQRGEKSAAQCCRLALAEIARLQSALKPFAALADRDAYTLDDVPHKLCIDAKMALAGIRVVGGVAAAYG